jgi:Flp pilus assembly protein TadD
VFRLRQAVELAPGDTRARNNLILALATSGDDAQARRLLAGVTDPQQRAEVEAELAKMKVAATASRPSS